MDIKQRRLTAYVIFFAAVATFATVLRTVASFLHLSDLGYYEGKLSPIANYTVFVTVVLLIGSALFLAKDPPKRAHFGGALTYAPAAPLGLSFIFLGVSLFMQKTESKLEKFALPLLAILAIAGALYFLFVVLYEVKRSDLRAVFAMVLTLFLILYAGYLYFESELPINATTKLCDQVAFVFAAIFFLYETRISLSKERWALYTSIGFSASLLCAYSSIPTLAVYFFEGRMISHSLEQAVVTFFLFAFIFCRTLLSLLLKDEKPTAYMEALHADAKRIENAVAAHGPLPFEEGYDGSEGNKQATEDEEGENGSGEDEPWVVEPSEEADEEPFSSEEAISEENEAADGEENLE